MISTLESVSACVMLQTLWLQPQGPLPS